MRCVLHQADRRCGSFRSTCRLGEVSMQRSHLAISALVLALGFFGGSSVLSRPLRAQAAGEKKTAAARPGDAPYTPTKLEWAALELQALYGSPNWTTPGSPVTINFLAFNDGTSVLCIMHYTPDVTAQVLKTQRDSEQRIFDQYARGRGWSWLRVQFREEILSPPSR